jgi:hypothetical protein
MQLRGRRHYHCQRPEFPVGTIKPGEVCCVFAALITAPQKHNKP